jgi:hypothetical protein
MPGSHPFQPGSRTVDLFTQKRRKAPAFRHGDISRAVSSP